MNAPCAGIHHAIVAPIVDELAALLDSDPAEAVRRALTLPLTDCDTRSVRAAILTDGGMATRNLDAVRRATTCTGLFWRRPGART